MRRIFWPVYHYGWRPTKGHYLRSPEQDKNFGWLWIYLGPYVIGWGYE